MKILIVTPIFPPRTGGPATYIWELSQRLKIKYELSIVCFSDNPKRLSGVDVTSIKNTGFLLWRQLNLFFQVIIIGSKVDLIYIQGGLVVGFASTIGAWLTGKRTIMKFVGDEVWEDARMKKKTKKQLEDFYSNKLSLIDQSKAKLQKISLILSDQIIVPSKYLKNFLVKVHDIDKNKIRIINNAVVLPKLSIVKKNKQIATVGRLVPWKNIDQIIKAVAIARQSTPWKLVIIGEGPEEAGLKKARDKLKVGSWIRFIGRLSHKGTIRHIAQSSRIILYSDYEGLPHVLIEAMLVKTRIIASDIPANREMLKSYGTLVSLGNINELAMSINSNSKKLVEAQKYAMRKYSWQKHLTELNKVFIDRR